ncbi:hypothetical protein MJH12_16025 [bacterium]|nr:hypothetical protein [bacterium]
MEDGKIVMPAGFKKESTEVSKEIRKKIDQYIDDHGLNEFGDHKDTMYTGGTPLYDEMTGNSTGRYQHVLKKFPNLGK